MTFGGHVDVQIVTAPINAASIKTALSGCVAVVGGALGISGSYMIVSFNDGRGLAIAGVNNR